MYYGHIIYISNYSTKASNIPHFWASIVKICFIEILFDRHMPIMTRLLFIKLLQISQKLFYSVFMAHFAICTVRESQECPLSLIK